MLASCLYLTDEGTTFLARNLFDSLNGFNEHCNFLDWQSDLKEPMNAKPGTQKTVLRGASKSHNDCISRFKMTRLENFDLVGILWCLMNFK